MCLVIDKNEHKDLRPKLALKPIFVYKLLKTTNYGCYKTPYREKEIIFDVNGKCICADNIQQIGNTGMVGPGIHAYTSLLSAKLGALSFARGSFCIVKAIIPIFSRYFIGKCNCIVSNKMIITNEIIWDIC